MNKLYECIKTKKVNHSQAREEIYKVFLASEHALSVAEIMQKMKDSYNRKVSLNTIYRHLTLFVECDLAIMIQDDYKKAYYSLTGEESKVFLLCKKCNRLSEMTHTVEMKKMLSTLDKSDFITLHGRCEKCK